VPAREKLDALRIFVKHDGLGENPHGLRVELGNSADGKKRQTMALLNKKFR
jgi:hypothetical protein